MAALAVLVAVIAVYVQSLGGPFLWDDRLLVPGARFGDHDGSLAELVGSPYFSGGAQQVASSSYYRPLVTLSFALDHLVHGENAAGYHLTNVVLHAVNALLLFALCRRLETRAGTAALLATGWALLPRLAEAAAWVSGRTDLLASLFALAALVTWGPESARRGAAALCVGVGLLAKESALAGGLALAANAWVDAPQAPRAKRAAHTLVALAPLAVVLVAYTALRVAVLGVPAAASDLGPVARALTVLDALGTYAAMLLDAFRPRAIIGRVGATSVAGVFAGVAVLVAFVLALRHRERIPPRSLPGLALSIGALLPVLHAIPIPLATLAADRMLYLPAAGLVLALAPAIERLLGVERWRFAIAIALVASFAVVTARRVGVWSDEIEFWVQTYLETPRTNSTAAHELAAVYYRAGMAREALSLSERALDYDDPRRTTAHYNSALCLVKLGQHDAARARLGKLRKKGRHARDVELELARIELRAGDFPKARALLAPLVAAGHADAARLSASVPELERARSTLARLDGSSPAALRAGLATMLGDEPRAARAWLEVVKSPSANEASSHRALHFLAGYGDRAALARATDIHLRRFGRLDATLSRLIELRLAELERLSAAKQRLGLP